jgi:nicotinamidase-related amidase
MLDRKELIQRGTKALEEILELMEKLPVIKLADLPGEQTALVIVDMINGFTREGALMSPRVEGVIPEIVRLSIACDEQRMKKLAFADCHTEVSPEFEAYPVHCMSGTFEAEIVDEIKEAGGYQLILKNSTNGFLEEDFQAWLAQNPQTRTFIVTGDCTDICVQQFAITLKTFFNKNNQKARIIVPVNAVETYDLGMHQADFVAVMALYNMVINGVEVVAGVR